MSATELLDRPIAYHRVFVTLTGSVKAAILLSQAVYWQKRAKQKDGWWYKTAEDWEDETGLTRHEQDTARKQCEKYLKSERRGVPAKLFWKVDDEALSADLIAISQQTSLTESGKLDERKAANINKNTETTTETTSVVESANKTVDGILEMERQAQEQKQKRYPLREKIPEPYLEYSDWYVNTTGQKPRKSVISDWFLTFDDWTNAGLTVQDLEAAYKYATRPSGGFLVGRPGSLTNTAIALKSKPINAPQINKSSVEATKRMLEERENIKYSPPPPRDKPQSMADVMKGMSNG